MMESLGIWMLASVGGVLLLTGLPAWIALLGVTLAFCAGGLLIGALNVSVFSAAAPRLIGLLEQDLLQALPLYALMGALLNRLPLAGILFKVGAHAMRTTRTAPQWMSLGLGMMLAPINGSVGASIAMLSRTVLHRLHKAGVAPERGAALICVTSTFGVVIPPSLVLILLGDAMMRAHTEAANITHETVRIINTQDIFRSALIPAAILFLLCTAVAWWSERKSPTPYKQEAPPRWSERVIAIATSLFLAGLLAGVALGYFYAVEGAAAGAMALVLFGLGSRTLTRATLRDVLHDTMALSGALFALLVAATMFTLTLRIFGTDRWISSFITELHGVLPRLPSSC